MTVIQLFSLYRGHLWLPLAWNPLCSFCWQHPSYLPEATPPPLSAHVDQVRLTWSSFLPGSRMGKWVRPGLTDQPISSAGDQQKPLMASGLIA